MAFQPRKSSGGTRLIGDAAKNQATQNPTNIVFDAKRLIVRKISDATVQADEKLMPFNILGNEVGGKGSKSVLQIDDVDRKGTTNQFAPEEISGMVLRKMKETAETFLRSTVSHAMVMMPERYARADYQG